MSSDVWDYVIVGGGSAGCVVASRLSENPGIRVLLLEAGVGGLERTPFVTMPAGALQVFQRDLFSWKYKTLPDRSAAGRQDTVFAGKLLGGGSSVNGMMFIRGAAHDFDEWRDLGNEGWGYADVLPHFKSIEHTQTGSDEFRGREGPLGVDFAAPLLEISHRFIEAAIESGISCCADINGAVLEGVSRTPCSIHGGVRQSTARTFLSPALRRPNLHAISRALVARVLFEGSDAIGVEYHSKDRLQTAMAAREVVLCAGGVRSAQILMLAGVGERRLLAGVGVPVVHDLPGVGHNYMDHTALQMVYEVTLPTWSRELSCVRRILRGFQWFLTRTGPAGSGVSQAVAFVRSDRDLRFPDLQLTLIPLGPLSQPEAGPQAIRIYVSECRPKARGRLMLASANIQDPPTIDFNMFQDAGALGKIIQGVRIVRRIMSAGAISPYVTGELFPGAAVRDDGELDAAIRGAAVSMAHPSGTCRMGKDQMAVVDSQLRVRGLGRLRVADASVMPTLTSGNINAPVIMIGEKAAELIKRSWRRA